MEDKTFELLTQMYADFTAKFKDVKDDINTLKINVNTLKIDVNTLKSNVAKIGLKLENDTDRKVDLLLETREETNKRLDEIENKLDDISSKVEKQDVEIRVIKGAR